VDRPFPSRPTHATSTVCAPAGSTILAMKLPLHRPHPGAPRPRPCAWAECAPPRHGHRAAAHRDALRDRALAVSPAAAPAAATPSHERRLLPASCGLLARPTVASPGDSVMLLGAFAVRGPRRPAARGTPTRSVAPAQASRRATSCAARSSAPACARRSAARLARVCASSGALIITYESRLGGRSNFPSLAIGPPAGPAARARDRLAAARSAALCRAVRLTDRNTQACSLAAAPASNIRTIGLSISAVFAVHLKAHRRRHHTLVPGSRI